MDNRIIAISTDFGVGETFLSWSLHYLCGHKEYFNSEKKSWNFLTNQPLTDNFEPNRLRNIDDFRTMMCLLSATDTKDFHVFYFQSSLSLSAEVIEDSLDACSDHIVLSTGKNHNLYFSKFNQRATLPHNDEEFWSDFPDYFLKESFSSRDYSNLKNIWDKREFLALNIRPNQVIKSLDEIDLNNSHLLLDTFELYTMFDKTVFEVFDYLKLSMDQNRKEHWDNVYKQWQHIHLDRIRFAWYFDQIIDYTLNNYYMDLARFNLDLMQEACIQHHLIYNYNLNFKTWQLEKFSDTKQLHNLLEPNKVQITEI